MSIYRGFRLSKVPLTGPLAVRAESLREASFWSGYGWVGTMPDLFCAKAYVDWLHDVGPDDATIPMLDEYIEGHHVMVNGRESDGHALLARRLAGIAEALRDPALDSTALKNAFGALVETTNSLDCALDQSHPARATGNFFLASGKRDGVRYERMHLGNFGLPGEWNGDGLIAVGIGDGWVPAIAGRVLANPVSAYANMGIGTANSPTGSARIVFVAGPEPKIEGSSREDLDLCQTMIRNVFDRTMTAEVKTYLADIPDILEAVATKLEASRPKQISAEIPVRRSSPSL